MRLVRRLLGIAVVTAGVIYLRGRRRALRAAGASPSDVRSEVRFDNTIGTSRAIDEELVALATESGIADVDPEPISHVAGEGIDPVRDIAAHEELLDLRDRLPRH